MNEVEIREKLTDILLNEPQNYSAIIELSSALSAFDKDNVRFAVDAGVIDRLGKELVARPETAVSELVKNSYDADAKNVDITFIDSDEEGGTLIIEDDGVGMTREELIKGFMTISSTGKIHNPLSQLYNRKRAGRKGIGRFSVQRLGTSLIITSFNKNDEHGIKVSIKWEEYQNDKNLLGISNKIELIPKEKDSGTTLVIAGLREKWSEASIKRIYRYVGAIIQPFPLSKERSVNEDDRIGKTLDPGFKVEFFKRQGDVFLSIANEDTMIFKYAACTIEGIVDEKGYGLINVQSEKLHIDSISKLGKDRVNTKPFTFLRDINFKAHYFITSSDFIPPQQKTRISELADEIGGIRMYKNGFRVLPYGEPFFDWLRLDQSVRKRTVLPVHGNHNFFGFVEVNENAGLLEETSSREGLQENEAFRELQDFLYRGLITGVLQVASVRDVKQTTNQRDWPKKSERPIERIRNVAEKIVSEVSNIDVITREISEYSDKSQADIFINSLQANKLKDIARELVEVTREQEIIDKKQLEEIAMLRVLASLGLTIGEFTHEIRHYLITLTGHFKLITNEVSGNTKLSERISKIEKNVEILNTYASYFDETVSNNITRELAPQEIRDVVSNFLSVIKEDARRSNIELVQPEINGIDLFSSAMHPSEWSSILFNLYTNSKKAIKRSGNMGRIFIQVGKVDNKIYLDFSDNGDGIPEENQEKIFEAFYTTSSPAGHFANEREEMLGTGLGLKIVSDIISSYNGTIEVIQPLNNFSTCFRIEIPTATDSEIENLL